MSNIILKNKIINDKYTNYVYDTFDIQDKEETTVSIPMNLEEIKNFDWNIGVIFGNSGSGKTILLKELGEIKKINFDREKPLISNFDWMEPEEASLLLTSMGLSSIPTWLRPFHILSNGEQYRAMLAYLVSSAKDNEIILVDEYTSVVDRDVAKSMSFALQKYIRRQNKKIILASCHYDIMEWLMPDWTYSPQNGGTLERGDWLRKGRPQIKLQVSRVEYDTWNLFKKYHYLTEEANKSCKFFLFEWNNKPVGIVTTINQPGPKDRKNAIALSRTVVLPDFQGIGIGSKISEFCSAIFLNSGSRVFTKTANPALGIYRQKSSNWKATSKNGIVRKDVETDNKAKNRLERSSYCYEYVGEKISGYEHLLLPINEIRK